MALENWEEISSDPLTEPKVIGRNEDVIRELDSSEIREVLNSMWAQITTAILSILPWKSE